MASDTASVTVAYLCECGKKWTIPRKGVPIKGNSSFKCDCGRTIVVQDGIVYGMPKSSSRGSRR